MKPNLTSTGRNSETEAQCADIRDAVAGLIDLFKVRLISLTQQSQK